MTLSDKIDTPVRKELTGREIHDVCAEAKNSVKTVMIIGARLKVASALCRNTTFLTPFLTIEKLFQLFQHF